MTRLARRLVATAAAAALVAGCTSGGGEPDPPASAAGEADAPATGTATGDDQEAAPRGPSPSPTPTRSVPRLEQLALSGGALVGDRPQQLDVRAAASDGETVVAVASRRPVRGGGGGAGGAAGGELLVSADGDRWRRVPLPEGLLFPTDVAHDGEQFVVLASALGGGAVLLRGADPGTLERTDVDAAPVPDGAGAIAAWAPRRLLVVDGAVLVASSLFVGDIEGAGLPTEALLVQRVDGASTTRVELPGAVRRSDGVGRLRDWLVDDDRVVALVVVDGELETLTGGADGTSWERGIPLRRVVDAPVLGGGVLATTPAGPIAVVGAGEDGRSDLRVLSLAGAPQPRPSPVEALGGVGVQTPAAAVTLPSGELLVVGSSTHGFTEAQQSLDVPEAWLRDGDRWERAPLEELPAGGLRRVVDVVLHGDAPLVLGVVEVELTADEVGALEAQGGAAQAFGQPSDLVAWRLALDEEPVVPPLLEVVDRQRPDPLRGAGDQHVAAAVTADDGVVWALGRDGDEGALWRSTPDGDGWERAARAATQRLTLSAIAITSAGTLLVTGTEFDGPVVLRSQDGTSWRRATVEGGESDRVHALVEHPELGLVAAGERLRFEAARPRRPLLWQSADDGATWTSVPAPRPLDSDDAVSVPSTLLALPDGGLVIGGSAAAEVEPTENGFTYLPQARAWRTDDLGTFEELELRQDAAVSAVQSGIVRDGRPLLVGEVQIAVQGDGETATALGVAFPTLQQGAEERTVTTLQSYATAAADDDGLAVVAGGRRIFESRVAHAWTVEEDGTVTSLLDRRLQGEDTIASAVTSTPSGFVLFLTQSRTRADGTLQGDVEVLRLAPPG